jgi:hypothetical protein
MISSTHRFIYLHVPKTGGNSIQTLLQPYSDDEFVTRGHQDGRDRFEIEGKVTPRKHAFLADYASVLGRSLEDYTTIVSVRHPFARAISFYFSPHRWLKRKDGADDWYLENAFWSLDEFEKCLAKIVPMVEFINVNGRFVHPDQIIRFENLSTDFKRCAAVLGLDNIDLPHVNKSSATEMAQIAMTDSTARDLVADRFSTDYEVFGYSAR